MDVSIVNRNEYALKNIDDGFLSLMDSDGATKDNIKVPEGEKIVADFEDGKELIVCVLSAMGQEACISYKEAPKQ